MTLLVSLEPPPVLIINYGVPHPNVTYFYDAVSSHLAYTLHANVSGVYIA